MKFALFCVPAAALLVLWRRRGITSNSLYAATCVNVTASFLWLAALIGSIASGAVLFVFWPFFFIVGSILVCVLPTASVERKFLVWANVLMGVWWATLIAAPN